MLGILGMTAGVLRQRRKARAAETAVPAKPPVREVVAKVVLSDEQPVRSQLRHP